MIKRQILTTLILGIFLINLFASAYAITAALGSSRMVLRPVVNEEIEKYILVKNKNNVSVRIELTSIGDLVDYLSIKENNFTLSPEEDKKAYFTISSPEVGIKETKINVMFIPDEGNSVGLSATVIVIASEPEKPKFPYLLASIIVLLIILIALYFIYERSIKSKKRVRWNA